METVNAATYGNPGKVLSYTTESLRKPAGQLGKKGIAMSYVTVGKILEANGYSKQGNRKMLQVGEPNPNRNEQFEYINSNARAY
ncbi:MAG: ISAzo13 family transposase, partial [Spirochaetaceae bacterium]|nr:ISAzo13 family transposase [Spirochaetaceae bacterium]